MCGNWFRIQVSCSFFLLSVSHSKQINKFLCQEMNQKPACDPTNCSVGNSCNYTRNSNFGWITEFFLSSRLAEFTKMETAHLWLNVELWKNAPE